MSDTLISENLRAALESEHKRIKIIRELVLHEVMTKKDVRENLWKVIHAVGNAISPDLLWEQHNKQPFRENKSSWNTEYINKLKTELKNNFSKERFEHLVDVLNDQRKIQEINTERESVDDRHSNRGHEKKSGVFGGMIDFWGNVIINNTKTVLSFVDDMQGTLDPSKKKYVELEQKRDTMEKSIKETNPSDEANRIYSKTQNREK